MDAPTAPPIDAEPAPDPLRQGRWLLALLIVALVVRVPFLFESVWFDEACFSNQHTKRCLLCSTWKGVAAKCNKRRSANR